MPWRDRTRAERRCSHATLSFCFVLIAFLIVARKGIFMAVTEKQTSPSAAKVWGIGVRQVVYMALGAALYGGLSWLTNILQLPGTTNVSFRPAIVIPLFFGAVFGPWVGLFTGGIGNLIGDYISGYGVYPLWDIGNGIIGFIAGLAMLYTWGRYFKARAIVVAEIFS